MKKLFAELKKDDGVILYFVLMLLTVLFTSTAVTAGAGALEHARATGSASSQLFAVEAAKICQSTNCTASTIDADLKANATFKKLVEANGYSLADVHISNLIAQPNTTQRSQVTITVTRAAFIPLAEMIGRSNSYSVSSKATSSWTNAEFINTFSKGSYLPLIVNACNFPELITPESKVYSYLDNQACASKSEPRLWWFGNAGAQNAKDANGNSIPACYRNSTGPTLKVGDTINNASASTMPAQEDCPVNVDYVVPYFKHYTPGGTSGYQKVWTVNTDAVKTSGKTSSVVATATQTYTKTCKNSTDAFDSSNCTNDAGSPTPTTVNPCGTTKSCVNTVLAPVAVSTTAITTTAYGTVAGFMKVKLAYIFFDNPLNNNQARPEHQYKLAYAGKDIRLLPN